MLTRRLTPFEMFLEKQKISRLKNKKVTKMEYEFSNYCDQNAKSIGKSEDDIANNKSGRFLTNFFQQSQLTFNEVENIPDNKKQNSKTSQNQNLFFNNLNSSRNRNASKGAYATLNPQKTFKKLKLGQNLSNIEPLNPEMSNRAFTPVLHKKFQNFMKLINNTPTKQKKKLIVHNDHSNLFFRENTNQKPSHHFHYPDRIHEHPQKQEDEYYNLTKFYERKYNSKQHKLKSSLFKISPNKTVKKKIPAVLYEQLEPWQNNQNNNNQQINFW